MVQSGAHAGGGARLLSTALIHAVHVFAETNSHVCCVVFAIYNDM
jgi:hypothetical protein